MPKVRDMYANVLVEGYMYVVRRYYFEKVSPIIFHICHKCEILIRNCWIQFLCLSFQKWKKTRIKGDTVKATEGTKS